MAQKKRHQQTISRDRIVNPRGEFNVIRKGLSPIRWWEDLYHLLLGISWWQFIFVISCGYILTNVLFAIAYVLGGDGIENARPGNLEDAFFFSVQTMASIGYGAMYPKTSYANFLVTIESLLGLLGLAMASGLMFARFSRTTARVMFSKVAVITIHNGLPTFIFRVANERKNWIVEAQIRLTISRNETTKEGEIMRRFYDLPLVRNNSPLFALSWTVMHIIDEMSPLSGLDTQKMIDQEVEIIAVLTGTDETVASTIHARHSYVAEEIFANMRFVDILSKKNDGGRCINYSIFHEIEPSEMTIHYN